MFIDSILFCIIDIKKSGQMTKENLLWPWVVVTGFEPITGVC